MRRLGGTLMSLALIGGLVACGGADEDAGPPPAPDTFVAEGTSRLTDPFGDVEIESHDLPDGAVLTGAEYAVALGRYGVAAELTEETIRELRLRGDSAQATQAPWRAGAGREFLLVHFVEPEGREPLASNRFPTAAVLVEGQPRQLGETALLPNRIVVVSVPTGADATLAITQDGQTGSISIRTGKVIGPPPTSKPATLSPSAPPADGPVVSGDVDLADYVAVPGHGPGLGWDALIQVEIAVELRPYDEERGSAPKGNLWADVEVKLYGNATRVTFGIDLSRSLTIRTAGGQVLRIPAGTRLTMPNFHAAPGAAPNPTLTVPDVWSGVFQVPAKTRKLSVTYRTRGTATENSKKVTFQRRDTDNSGTITLK